MNNLVDYYLAINAPAVKKLEYDLDINEWVNTVRHLSQYNRHSFHDQILDAMEFIISKLSAIPNAIVRKQPVLVVYVERYNVIATIPGTKYPDRK
jgi:hypothetical protein